MTAENPFASRKPAAETRLERVIRGPRALVFEAWSKPEHLARWFGPRGFGMPSCTMEFRSGGAYRYNMEWPDGTPNWCSGHYLEVVPPERIVMTALLESHGNVVVLTTVDFVDQGETTLLRVHQCYDREDASTRGAPEGWKQTLDRLEELVATLG